MSKRIWRIVYTGVDDHDTVHLGYYSTEGLAVAAAVKARLKHMKDYPGPQEWERVAPDSRLGQFWKRGEMTHDKRKRAPWGRMVIESVPIDESVHIDG